jgi:nitronate monooxygenase
MAAALMLGADGVMMATRFLATKECDIHDNWKQEFVKRQEYETALICKSLGLQGRALRNKTVEKVLEVEAQGGGLDDLMPLISGQRGRESWFSGDVDDAPVYVGQSIGLIHDVPTVAELLDSMMKEAEEQITSLYNSIA